MRLLVYFNWIALGIITTVLLLIGMVAMIEVWNPGFLRSLSLRDLNLFWPVGITGTFFGLYAKLVWKVLH